MPKRTYLPKIEGIFPNAAVFSIRGRKDPVTLGHWSTKQLCINVPFRDTGLNVRASSWQAAKKDLAEFRRCIAENDLPALRRLAADYVKRADDFRAAIRREEQEAAAEIRAEREWHRENDFPW